MNIIGKFFKILTDALNGGEKYIIDFISTFVPYAVPVIPAYLTYHHTINEMGFPSWVALTAAFVVEALGLASVATAVRFWQHNKKYKTDANRAPFKLAVMVYLFYIVVVIVVNVVLELVAQTRNGWVILSIALFSLLSFPASVLISIRYIHSDILEDRARAKAGYRNQDEGSPSVPQGPRRPKFASQYKEQMITMLNQEYQASGRVLTPKEITTRLKLDHDKSKGFVSTTTSQWKMENGIKPDDSHPLKF
jgi:uncharacterized membrane protein YidH (DUF202 family)